MELSVIQNKIFEIRGKKVMLDFDLAELYEVQTKVLNQTVKRNINRFPSDFLFQLRVKNGKSWNYKIGYWGMMYPKSKTVKIKITGHKL